MADDPERRQASSLQAITLAQPDAWCIAKGYRPLINTKWAPPTDMQGKMIAIHTIERPGKAQLRQLERRAAQMRDAVGVDMPPLHRLPYDSVVAVVRCSGVFTEPPEDFELGRWFQGPYGWVLDDPVPILPPLPCRGAKELWTVPQKLLPSLRKHYQNGKQHLRRQAERLRNLTEEQEERLALQDPKTH